MKEADLQIQIAQWLEVALPDTAVWWHTVNEGDFPVQYRVKRKAMGLRPGIPDLFILYNSRLIGIELKTPARRKNLSESQRETLKDLTVAGAITTVCTSLDEVHDFLHMLMPLRATV